jgi:superfamily I DNA and RNA helicase
MNGFLYELTRDRGGPFTYLHVNEEDERDARRRAAGYLKQVEQLKRAGVLERYLFDTIYLDEGQDLEDEEYRLLLELIRPDRRTGEKNLIVFYDDAQNLYGRPRPRWADLGLKVDFGRRSRVMKECHRNTREIIEFAFNVLVGSRAPAGVRVTTRAFADIETLKDNKLITEGDSYIDVHFAKRSGPPPVVKPFKDRQAERAWVAGEVSRLVDEEHVRPEDILVLAEERGGLCGLPAAISARSRAEVAFSEPHLRTQKDDYILKPGHLTATTTRSAKGYDGYVAFVVGADTFPLTSQGRASFYVGCSRARLRLYVTGIGGNGTLIEEAEAVSQASGSGR